MKKMRWIKAKIQDWLGITSLAKLVDEFYRQGWIQRPRFDEPVELVEEDEVITKGYES
jgi:hypothetical protein